MCDCVCSQSHYLSLLIIVCPGGYYPNHEFDLHGVRFNTYLSVFKDQSHSCGCYLLAESRVQALGECDSLSGQVVRQPLVQVGTQHQQLNWVGVRQVRGLSTSHTLRPRGK